MLDFIAIKNYALIESTELEFSPGFNVFTGESGAGKSILMSAVDLLLGGRADRGAIRSGCSRAEISGCFSVPEYLLEEVSNLLEEADIAFDRDTGELYLRRVISAAGTRNYINDTPVSARLISAVGCLLMDRHGAGEQLSLLQPVRQLELLDRYGSLLELRKKCAGSANALNELEKELSEFESSLPDEAEADRLSLMIEEITRVSPVPGEDEELAARHRLASNSHQILSAAAALVSELYEGENSIADRLGTVCRDLGELARIDEKSAEPLISSCMSIQEAVSELSRSIEELANRIELDPEEFSALEERMSALHTLKRRYAPTVETLLELLAEAEAKLDDFKRSAVKRQEFIKRREELKQQLAAHCRELSLARKAAAEKLVVELVDRLEIIGFHHAKLEPEFSECEDSANGCDRFELMFSANPGENVRPLRKIASSGELSRIMLAFKVVLADSDAIPTVVFDEIDMNIGGDTANKVGEALKLLGKRRQILSISHLAQVASRADRHFLVEKHVSGGRTFSAVRQLEQTQSELARMIGSWQDIITEQKQEAE